MLGFASLLLTLSFLTAVLVVAATTTDQDPRYELTYVRISETVEILDLIVDPTPAHLTPSLSAFQALDLACNYPIGKVDGAPNCVARVEVWFGVYRGPHPGIVATPLDPLKGRPVYFVGYQDRAACESRCAEYPYSYSGFYTIIDAITGSHSGLVSGGYVTCPVRTLRDECLD